MDKTRYITTPLYYVNAEPHLGHAYTTVAADILSRYYRLAGYSVFFLTGTDEHGQKVEKAASERAMSVKEHTDDMANRFKDLWSALNISYDGFIRTTDPQHEKVVKEMLTELYDKGDIEKRSYTGWYCVPDERFWMEKDLEDGCCPDCGRKVEHIEEENYFFLMSKYQDGLIRHIENSPGYIMPEMRRNEVLGFLKNNRLDDLCISRPKSRLSWGIPIPFDSGYVTYVWFDALVNYYSATKYLAPQDRQWWPASCHLIGKDILTTHSVYWSTMLMALGLELPDRIFAHGWWLMEDEKMSKSLGNVINPLGLAEKFGADAFRFYLFRHSVFGKDARFSGKQFSKIYETELANELGNLLSRTLSMIGKYEVRYRADQPIINYGSLLEETHEHYEGLNFYGVLETVWDVVRQANTYIEEKKPWVLAREDHEELERVLSQCFCALRFIAWLIFPFMPESSLKMQQQLGIDITGGRDIPDFSEAAQLERIDKGDPLFPKNEKEIFT